MDPHEIYHDRTVGPARRSVLRQATLLGDASVWTAPAVRALATPAHPAAVLTTMSEVAPEDLVVLQGFFSEQLGITGGTVALADGGESPAVRVPS